MSHQIEIPLQVNPPCQWPLWLRRQWCERLFDEMEREMRAALQQAWRFSVHHGWLEDAVDFIERRNMNPSRWVGEGKTLSRRLTQLHREGSDLYIREEESVRRCAAHLIKCGRALAALSVAESRVFRQSKREAA